jgi:hypothetical protein
MQMLFYFRLKLKELQKVSNTFKCHILALPLRQILKAFHAKYKKHCDHRTR